MKLLDGHTWPKRQIEKRTYFRTKYNRPGEGGVLVGLACGHVKRYKLSREPKSNFARCQECAWDALP